MSKTRELPEVGQRVRFTTKTAWSGSLEPITRDGVVTCVWSMGWGEESVDTDGGSFHPSLGDTWEALPSGDPQ